MIIQNNTALVWDFSAATEIDDEGLGCWCLVPVINVPATLLMFSGHSWQNQVLGLKIHYPRSFNWFDIPKSMVLTVSIQKNHNGNRFWENYIFSKNEGKFHTSNQWCAFFMTCDHFRAKFYFEDPILNLKLPTGWPFCYNILIKKHMFM